MLKFIAYRFCVGKDYYRILQLSAKASQEEVKAQYRRLAKMYHPDTNATTEERFKMINEAYEVIGDPQKRKDYDTRSFGQTSTGERYSRSTYNTNFHYGAGRRANRANSRAWEGAGQSARPNERSEFYQQYIRSQENVHKQFREDLDLHYRMNRFKMRNIVIGSILAYSLFELFLYWQSRSYTTYQLVDPDNGIIYYATAQNMQRMKLRRQSELRMRKQLELQRSMR